MGRIKSAQEPLQRRHSHREQRAHLRERLPAGLLDEGERLGLARGCRWVVLRSKLKGRFENATIGG